MYDDHEILNNYAGQGNDSQPPFPAASDAFNIYHAASNYEPIKPNQYHYNFQYGDSAFFVMDTRRHRTRNTEDPSLSTMLGDSQLADLFSWLTKVFFFVPFIFETSHTCRSMPQVHSSSLSHLFPSLPFGPTMLTMDGMDIK